MTIRVVHDQVLLSLKKRFQLRARLFKNTDIRSQLEFTSVTRDFTKHFDDLIISSYRIHNNF